MKRLALAIALFTSAALLSGCIIVPHRHGHRGGDRHHYSDSYDRSPGYGQPGPRRY